MSAHRPERADPQTYRPLKGQCADYYSDEQDTAAGGRGARLITRADGSVVSASVALRCFPNSRRVYAYLRWAAVGGGTSEKYLGDVSDQADRKNALCAAWSRARTSRLAGSETVETNGEA